MVFLIFYLVFTWLIGFGASKGDKENVNIWTILAMPILFPIFIGYYLATMNEIE
jgi:biotin transporter BioY